MKIHVKGNKELQTAIRRLSDGINSQTMGQAVTAGSDSVTRRAKERAAERTGYMKEHTHTELVIANQDYAESGTVSDADYTQHVEYGTADTPAQPFLRPALDEGGAEAVQIIGDQLGNTIKGLF